MPSNVRIPSDVRMVPRTYKRVGGTVTSGAHFDAWNKACPNINGKDDYMIPITKGYHNSGSSCGATIDCLTNVRWLTDIS